MRSLAARRFLLPALLAAATLLFAVGVIAERSTADDHTEPAVSAASSEAGEAGHAEEQGEEGEVEPAGARTESAEERNEEERLLGVDIESAPLIVLAVLAGLALSAAAASDLRRRRAFLGTVAVIALAWAARTSARRCTRSTSREKASSRWRSPSPSCISWPRR